ncbi:endonuclease/exonuclease/phosphatase family protein [Roseiconus lacunae]|uniref:Endonuclease/exonuclease/phosphatase family protein n=1 Tax=Roseiconus lacunae TaxID=2605694 RepID=A0ABT7PCG1_9BACT|nr:endonuclease/exonuclease/phosphatase family protein [Roseiconus lacunae]MDM4014174.1 endonuclease/exonuclease/phosphatase family protein [Roseiconus lacunae]
MILRLLACALMTGLSFSTALSQQDAPQRIRIATYNVSLYGKEAAEIRQRLSSADDTQAKDIARVVQTVRPDILLVNELDYDKDAQVATLLAKNYFAVGQSVADNETLRGIDYPYVYSAPSNTGVDSSLDLNKDGQLQTANDAFGYGIYPGQYAMTIYSRFPIQNDQRRTFQTLKWSAMPGAIRPSSEGASYYRDSIWRQLRLSSKNHLDVPVQVGKQTIHVLASHPTPPVFDGPEDRNGARNHDEVMFWVHYIDAKSQDADSTWIVDDLGNVGGLSSIEPFVVMGDLNADPVDGNSRREAIRQLISHPRVNDVEPKATEEAISTRRSRYRGRGDLATKTADWGRNLMRVDYVLPSVHLNVVGSGVFWPGDDDPREKWIRASDHRLVWIEVQLP